MSDCPIEDENSDSDLSDILEDKQVSNIQKSNLTDEMSSDEDDNLDLSNVPKKIENSNSQIYNQNVSKQESILKKSEQNYKQQQDLQENIFLSSFISQNIQQEEHTQYYLCQNQQCQKPLKQKNAKCQFCRSQNENLVEIGQKKYQNQNQQQQQSKNKSRRNNQNYYNNQSNYSQKNKKQEYFDTNILDNLDNSEFKEQRNDQRNQQKNNQNRNVQNQSNKFAQNQSQQSNIQNQKQSRQRGRNQLDQNLNQSDVFCRKNLQLQIQINNTVLKIVYGDIVGIEVSALVIPITFQNNKIIRNDLFIKFSNDLEDKEYIYNNVIEGKIQVFQKFECIIQGRDTTIFCFNCPLFVELQAEKCRQKLKENIKNLLLNLEDVISIGIPLLVPKGSKFEEDEAIQLIFETIVNFLDDKNKNPQFCVKEIVICSYNMEEFLAYRRQFNLYTENLLRQKNEIGRYQKNNQIFSPGY